MHINAEQGKLRISHVIFFITLQRGEEDKTIITIVNSISNYNTNYYRLHTFKYK